MTCSGAVVAGAESFAFAECRARVSELADVGSLAASIPTR
jgi:hypothetical protein